MGLRSGCSCPGFPLEAHEGPPPHVEGLDGRDKDSWQEIQEAFFVLSRSIV